MTLPRLFSALGAWCIAATAQYQGLLVDPTGAPVPAVRIELGASFATTTDTGEFRFVGLVPGAYTLRIAVAGFEPVRRTVRVSAQRSPPVTIHLALAARRDEITVPAEDRTVTVEAARNAIAISVERNFLDNLPVLDNEALAALSRFLNPGLPGDSGPSLIVDGMEARNTGVTASAIQEIRINNNPYTAEYPRWSRRRIEVITKSAADAWHGTLNFLFRDQHLNARGPLAAARPPEQRRIIEGSLYGPVPGSKRTALLLSGARQSEDLYAVVVARTPLGPLNANVPTPQQNTQASAKISHQPNDRHAMFWQINFQDRWRNNVGAGGTALAESAAQSRFREDEFVFNHRGVITPNLLSQFRILLGRYWSPTKSNSPTPAIVVNGAFSGGGAQADRLSTEAHTSITWLLTQTRGAHTLKYGFNVPDWSRRGLRDDTNRAGTLSYASLEEFAAGRAYAAVLQRGNPYAIFIEKNLGWFLQDEWRIRNSLSIAPGLRYDWQNNFGDTNNVSPRLGIAWSPDKARKWVIRPGAGLFYDRSGPAPVWDTLRYDGIRLRRYVVTGPVGAPESIDVSRLPSAVDRIAARTQLPSIAQFSVTVERQLAAKTLLAAGYTGTRGWKQFRSRDANAPLPPVFAARPDAAVNALRLIESAGRIEANSFEVLLRGDLAPRVTGFVQYTWSKTMADAEGLGWYPADSFAPAGEWGRASTDRRHSLNLLASAALHRWLNLGVSMEAGTGLPFNVTTGGDENGDGLALDRPPGISRNTGLGPGVFQIDARWYRKIALKPGKDTGPSLTLSVDAFNLPNRVNYRTFVGNRTSPFFGRAVEALPPRRVQLGARFDF